MVLTSNLNQIFVMTEQIRWRMLYDISDVVYVQLLKIDFVLCQ